MTRKKLLVGVASLLVVAVAFAGKSMIKSKANPVDIPGTNVAAQIATGTGNSTCEHTYTKEVVTKEATCTRKGRVDTVCDECGKVMSSVITPALGHEYVDYACTRCGDKDKPKLWRKYNTENASYRVTLPLSNGMGNVSLVEPLYKDVTEFDVPKEVTINGIVYQVTKVEDKAFEGCNNLKKVTIGKEVKTIGKYAFANLPKLKKVSFKSGLKTIEKGAFRNCSELRSINIPRKVKKIENEAFTNCYELDKVTIGKNVNTIGKEAFANCPKLRKVELGASVKTIEKRAFYNCGRLDEIKIKGVELKKIEKEAFTGIAYNATIKIPSEDYDRIAALFTAEVGYQTTMTLKLEKGLLEIIQDLMSSDDEESEDVESEDVESEEYDEEISYNEPAAEVQENVQENTQEQQDDTYEEIAQDTNQAEVVF